MASKARKRRVGGNMSDEWDQSDSEHLDSTGTEEDSSSHGAGSGVLENSTPRAPLVGSKPHAGPTLSGASWERRAARKDPNFIKVNSRPMMEMEDSSNVWYQARILKERATELLVTFPGVKENEDETQQWVSKLSGRIWYGEYRSKAWKYLGKGSWRPKASAKKKIPPAVLRLRKEGETGLAAPGAAKDLGSQQRGANTGGGGRHGAEQATAKAKVEPKHGPKAEPKDEPMKGQWDNPSADEDEWAERTSPLRPAAPPQPADSAQGSQKLGGGGGLSALAKWFDVHFQRLRDADLLRDHPAGYAVLEADRAESHRSASTSREGSPRAPGHPHSGGGGALKRGDSLPHPRSRERSRLRRTKSHGHDGSSDQEEEEEEDALPAKRRRTPPNHQPVLDSEEEEEEEEEAKQSPRRKRPAKAMGRPAQDRSRNKQRRSKEWKLSKELCHLLDNNIAYDITRGGRHHHGAASRGGSARGTAQHSSASEASGRKEEEEEDARGAGECSKAAAAAADVTGARRTPHVATAKPKARRPEPARKAGAPLSKAPAPRIIQPPPPRGRVLMSDSESEEEEAGRRLGRAATRGHLGDAGARRRRARGRQRAAPPPPPAGRQRQARRAARRRKQGARRSGADGAAPEAGRARLGAVIAARWVGDRQAGWFIVWGR